MSFYHTLIHPRLVITVFKDGFLLGLRDCFLSVLIFCSLSSVLFLVYIYGLNPVFSYLRETYIVFG